MDKRKLQLMPPEVCQSQDKKYSAYKLEFLALEWDVTEKLKDYLMGPKIT